MVRRAMVAVLLCSVVSTSYTMEYAGRSDPEAGVRAEVAGNKEAQTKAAKTEAAKKREREIAKRTAALARYMNQ